MKADHLAAALCTAELLRTRTNLDHRLRSLIISLVPGFDTRSPSSVVAGVAAACRNAGLSPAQRRFPRPRIEQARVIAEEWIARGVFLMNQDRMVNPKAHRHNLPPIVFAWGRRSILDRPTVSILNSRTSRRVTPRDTWLAATKTLFRVAAEKRPAVISSYGTVPYSVVSRLAYANGLPLIIACGDVLPFTKSSRRLEEFMRLYGDLFDLERTLFLSPYPPGRMPPSRTRFVERDELVAALSSVIMVAAVREGGTMEAVTKRAARRRTGITVFLPDRPDRSTSGNVAIVKDTPNGAIQTVTGGFQPLPVTVKQGGADRPRGRAPAVLTWRGWPKKGSWLIHYAR
ncbi:MAG: DNA-processing protein DprA, partial [Deltaproteobacteria bacterium]